MNKKMTNRYLVSRLIVGIIIFTLGFAVATFLREAKLQFLTEKGQHIEVVEPLEKKEEKRRPSPTSTIAKVYSHIARK